MGRRNKIRKIPLTVKLCQTILDSIYKDADKNMWVCKTLKGTSLILSASLPTNELHKKIREINNAEGTYFPTPKAVKTSPRQLKFSFEDPIPYPAGNN